jgi:hypothetical protein
VDQSTRRQSATILDEQNPEVMDQAEGVYERLLSEEGFSEEQAFAIAMSSLSWIPILPTLTIALRRQKPI